MSLAGALERAAEALPSEADAIRPANGDPRRLLAALAPEGAARVLAALLEREEEEAEELLDAWLVEPGGVAAVLAVDEASLPSSLEITHRSLNDQTIEGVSHREFPAFSVQYHPEASAGPHDSHYLFDHFLTAMRA